MTGFDYLHAIRFLISRHEGGIYQQELREKLDALTSVTPIEIDSAIDQLIESGELSPHITNGGKTLYMWTGGYVQD